MSLITSHAISTSRAEHTTSYRGKATTSFISYHQLKTWSLLSKDNQSKSWEKMWATKTEIVCHWSLLMLLELGEQSIQLLIGAEQQLLLYHTINLKLGHCYQKTINLNLGRRCGKTEIVCHWSLLMSLELAEQSIQFLTCR